MPSNSIFTDATSDAVLRSDIVFTISTAALTPLSAVRTSGNNFHSYFSKLFIDTDNARPISGTPQTTAKRRQGGFVF